MKEKQILIVEDRRNVVEEIEEILSSIAGISVINAAIYKDAWAWAQRLNVDLFIIDVAVAQRSADTLPGIRLAEELRACEKYEWTPIIFISPEGVSLDTFPNMHLYHYFEKHLDREAFRNTVITDLHLQFSKREKDVWKLKDGAILYYIRFREIIYIEVNRKDGVVVHCVGEKKYRVPYRPMKEVLRLIDSPQFWQCYRNLIVNRAFVGNIRKSEKLVELKHPFGTLPLGENARRQLK